jgi:phosphoribosylformimino-5-aminoimidazole carboxamide ribotide isomerase
LFEHFTVIPAIDLKGGRVVRLMRGEMDRATVYASDPAEVAREFERGGAELIHVVDLDGAIAGEPRNLEAIARIRAAVSIEIDLSGGLRTIDAVRSAFAAGADRISLGSIAFLDPSILEHACREFSGKVFGSVDARDGLLAIKGWIETSSMTVSEGIARFRDAGVDAVILTDIARDGAQKGVDAVAMAGYAQAGGVRVIASGGVASLADIAALSRRFRDGVVGVVVGRAIYQRNFTLAEAIATSRQS